jgi:hypothetical protein
MREKLAIENFCEFLCFLCEIRREPCGLSQKEIISHRTFSSTKSNHRNHRKKLKVWGLTRCLKVNGRGVLRNRGAPIILWCVLWEIADRNGGVSENNRTFVGFYLRNR